MNMIGISSIIAGAAAAGRVLMHGIGLLGKVGPAVTKVATTVGLSAGKAKVLGTVTGVAAQTVAQLGAERLVDETLGKVSPTAAKIVNNVVDGAMLYSAFGGKPKTITKVVYKDKFKSTSLKKDLFKTGFYLGGITGVAGGAGLSNIGHMFSNDNDRKEKINK